MSEIELRIFLEWLSLEDYFNISKDEIDEILGDWQTYKSNRIEQLKKTNEKHINN